MDSAQTQHDVTATSPRPLLGLLIPRSRPQHPIAEVLLVGARAYAGITIASAGLDKLPTPDWMVDQVTSMGFPAPEFFAMCACVTEFAFGIMLAFGVLTRISALLLAFTMGVAAFGFHKVTPFTGMHIAQGYVWLFVAFLAIGPGRLSVDHLVRWLIDKAPSGRIGLTGPAIAAAATAAPLALAGYYEFLYTAPPTEPEPPVEITSVTAPGSFNQWDLNATPLALGEDGKWSTVLVLEEAGPISFKLAGNASWDLSVGDTDQTAARFPIEGIGEADGGNIEAYIPEPGRYLLEFDLSSRRYGLSAAPDPNRDQ